VTEFNRPGVGAPTILPIPPAPPEASAVALAASETAPIPGFLFEKTPGSGFWESVRVACSRSGSVPLALAVPLERAFLKKSGASSKSFGLALVLESLAIAGILYLPQYLPVDRPEPVAFAAEPPEVIYYEVPVAHTQTQVPQIAPPGDAGRPGEGAKPEETPTKGSTASLGDLTVVSKPLQPDNHHQTIIQPLSPPDLRITQDVKLPNVIMGNLSAPRSLLTFSAQNMPKPVQGDRQVAAASAPSIADPTRNNALPGTASEPAIAKPQLPIEPLKPNQLARGNGGPGAAAPTPSLAEPTRGNGLPLTAGDPTIAKPQLPMGIAKPVQQARGNGAQNSAAAPSLADPTRGDDSVLIAANEPTVAKPALPVAIQRPIQQGRAGGGQNGSNGAGGPAAPTVAEAASAGGLSNFGGGGTGPAAPQVPGLPRPIQQSRGGNGQGSQGGQGGLAAAPSMTEPARGVGTPNFGGAGNGPAAPLPQIPGLQRPVQQARAGNGVGGGQASQGADGAPVLSDANGLMIIGVDPSPAGSQIAVPPGNRWGDFTIAPARGPGSPGGTTSGGSTQAGTTGQNGSGGDRSVGVGVGGTGGGGGPSSASLGPISVKGTLPGSSGEPLLLTGSVAAEMVFPLPISVVSKLRPNRMVVSAGSIGGGGLSVYGALACSKIYTIFLPMPGSSWTMQFCQKSADPAGDKAQAQTKVIQLSAPIVPPDPNEDGRFDFKRVPVPAEKTQNKMIVLKGTLDEQGSVQNLQVYQGVQPEMDQAAQIAFSRWKFKPAMQSNKAVSVEILVGIPAQIAPPAPSPAPAQAGESH
jgi:TonB family protein